KRRGIVRGGSKVAEVNHRSQRVRGIDAVASSGEAGGADFEFCLLRLVLLAHLDLDFAGGGRGRGRRGQKVDRDGELAADFSVRGRHCGNGGKSEGRQGKEGDAERGLRFHRR